MRREVDPVSRTFKEQQLWSSSTRSVVKLPFTGYSQVPLIFQLRGGTQKYLPSQMGNFAKHLRRQRLFASARVGAVNVRTPVRTSILIG